MELSHKGELELARALKRQFKGMSLTEAEVVVCPSHASLAAVGEVLGAKSKIGLGAQHVHWEEKGAWTGAVSVLQVASYVKWCLVGHSEQRMLSGVTEENVQRTANMLMQHDIVPVVCIGETREEREADQTVAKITGQVEVLLSKMMRASLTKLAVAYEPIWAIGTGDTPDPIDVAGIMLLIRKIVAGRFGNEAAQRLRILYGGSVKSSNVEPYVKEPGVDGVLVGGASVEPRQFLDIVKVLQRINRQ